MQDLLKPANENLQIREGSNGVFVSGVEEQPVGSMHDCLRLMQLGDRNRQAPDFDDTVSADRAFEVNR